MHRRRTPATRPIPMRTSRERSSLFAPRLICSSEHRLAVPTPLGTLGRKRDNAASYGDMRVIKIHTYIAPLGGAHSTYLALWVVRG